MKDFNSFFEYSRFIGASGFRKNDQEFKYSPNLVEKFGHFLIQPLEIPVGFLIRNVKNPLFVVASTMIALFFTAALYYPSSAGKVISFLAKKLKFPTYLFIQVQILAFGIRTLGRIGSGNNELMNNWRTGNLTLVPFARG